MSFFALRPKLVLEVGPSWQGHFGLEHMFLSLPLDLSLSWKLAMHGKATLAWKMFLFLAAWPLWLGRCLQDGAFLCNLGHFGHADALAWAIGHAKKP